VGYATGLASTLRVSFEHKHVSSPWRLRLNGIVFLINRHDTQDLVVELERLLDVAD
jgi:hypothetical protein